MPETPIRRHLQLSLLRHLAKLYPARVEASEMDSWPIALEDKPLVFADLVYLEEHKLIEAVLYRSGTGFERVILARITAEGIDLLEDDGGLSAILGVVTAKLHEDTIRNLVLAEVKLQTRLLASKGD